jgi:hypothetical protein
LLVDLLWRPHGDQSIADSVGPILSIAPRFVVKPLECVLSATVWGLSALR